MKRYAPILVSMVALAAPATPAAFTSTTTVGTPWAQIDEASWGTGAEPASLAWQTDEEASWGT